MFYLDPSLRGPAQRALISIVISLSLVACGDGSSPGAPDAPETVAARPHPGFVEVTWMDGSDDEESFLVGRVTLATVDTTPDEATLEEIGEVTADQLFFRDTTAEDGRFYAYAVAASNEAGRSEFVFQDHAGVTPIAGEGGAGCVIALVTPDDADGDGLPNDVETTGWTVSVDETGGGVFTETTVTSDPNDADSDDDGLCDTLERQLRTHPGTRDTDGDGLTDFDELRIWGSSPINVDSDGDAEGNTAFFDGAELERYGTSPTLADTDGDGRSDFAEINQNATNARLADVPRPRIDLSGAVVVDLEVTYEDGSSNSSAYSVSMSEESSSSIGQTYATTTATTTDVAAEVSGTLALGNPTGLKGSASLSVSRGYVDERGATFDQASATSSRQAYASAVEGSSTNGETIRGGTLKTSLTIVNDGSRTFALDDLVVTAMAPDPENASVYTAVATLRLPETANGVVLSEGQSAGPFAVEGGLSTRDALALLANPRGLYFVPASFRLLDRTGTDFEFSVGETTSARTALVAVDYGGARATEKYRVATNVTRVDGGQLAGVRLIDALSEILGLGGGVDFELATTSDGVEVLTRFRDVAATSAGSRSERFWMIIAADNGTSPIPVADRLLGAELDFSEIVLMPRDRVYLALVADADDDGVPNGEEVVHGTSDAAEDTDGDGLTDREEIDLRWRVLSTLAYYASSPLVAPNPGVADADGDGLNDMEERDAGTDPNRADTDGDGTLDGDDDEPLRGLVAPYLNVVGTVADELVLDVGHDGVGNVIVFAQVEGADTDGDGLLPMDANARMLASYDERGEKRWAIELEEAGAEVSMVDIHPDGTTYWLQHVVSGIDEISSEGIYLIVVDRDGLISSTALAPVPSPGELRDFECTTDVLCYHLVNTTRGPQLYQYGVDGITDQHIDYNVTPAFFGVFDSMFISAHTGGLWIQSGDAWGLAYDRALMNPMFYDFPDALTLLADVVHRGETSTWAMDTGGTLRFFDRRPEFGNDAAAWESVGPQTVAATDMSVDDLGQATVAAPTVSGEVAVRAVQRSGVLAFDVTMPALEQARVVSDGRGATFVVGSASGGYDGREGVGARDIVIARNPQFRYGP